MAAFDPNSNDAMFATILQRLNSQDEILTRIDTHLTTQSGRVTALEQWREVTRAKTAVIAAGVSAAVGAASWAVKNYFEGR